MANLEVTEMIPFDYSWVLPGAVQSVSISVMFEGLNVEYPTPTDANYDNLTYTQKCTVRVFGLLDSVFTRSLTYIDLDGLTKITSSFGGLPLKFNTITRYSAPTEVYKDTEIVATYLQQNAPVPPATTGTMESKTDTLYFVVRNNWQDANAAFVEALKRGLY